MKNPLTWYKNSSVLVKVITASLLLGLVWFGYKKINSSKSVKPQYQTSAVQKGTLISTITASGNIAGGNNTTIYTSASGLVTKVYVKNGDKVTQGQKLAEIQLDQDAAQKQTAAWASYLTAVNNSKNSEINKLSLVNSVDSANKSVMDAQNAVNIMNDNISNGSGNPATHKSYTDLEKNSITSALTLAQQNYNIANQKLAQADAAITTAKAQVSSAWYTYQQSSPTITAPATGVITNFALTPGLSIGNLASSTSANTNSNTTQSIGTITNPNNQVTASIDLTEIDVVKAAPNQKVTITLDAFPDKSFTGKVLAINTGGQVSSGVTTYPTTLVFDNGLPNMYPNMAVNAKIITQIKNDVLYVPTAAVQSNNGQAYVRVLKDGQISNVDVETGITDDTNTEIINGLNEGDIVVTSIINNSKSNGSSSTSSPFSSFGNRGFGGGGQVRIQTR